MKKNLRHFALGLFLLFAGSFVFSSAASAAAKGETYYTRMNIWYEHPEKIYSTNYHKGAILPVGTEVEILKTGSKIKFRDKKSGTEYRLILVDDYTDISKDEFFNRYFSKDSILDGSEYRGFSSMEKENIKNGTIAKGMSKAAVLVAYGYPPTHRTPSTSGNLWKFWTSRLLTDDVHFENDRVSNIVE